MTKPKIKCVHAKTECNKNKVCFFFLKIRRNPNISRRIQNKKCPAKWHISAVMDWELEHGEVDLRRGVPRGLRCWLTHTLAVVWKWIRSLLPSPRLLLHSLFISLTVVWATDRTRSYWTHHKAFIKVNTAPLYTGVKHLLAGGGREREREKKEIELKYSRRLLNE